MLGLLLCGLQEDNSPQLRVLRLKHYIDADANCLTIDTILDGLEQCTQVRSPNGRHFGRFCSRPAILPLVVRCDVTRRWKLFISTTSRKECGTLNWHI